MEDLLSSSATAAVLAEQIPDKTSAQWTLWLQNNRNPARNAVYRVPFERVSGGVFYRADEVAKFAEWEKSRKLGTLKLTGPATEALRAFGIGEQGGGTTGRRLDCDITVQVDPANSRPYAQLLIKNPLLVFRLEAEQVKQLHRELGDTVRFLERHAK
ncbi:hypothetical protein [Paraburkholderia dipogonis]|uniref:hypothetical protein n=1 Tax=Paraburkholderia dipogonis TaxID=1211383 RepID=UPI0038BA086F